MGNITDKWRIRFTVKGSHVKSGELVTYGGDPIEAVQHVAELVDLSKLDITEMEKI